MVDAQHFWPGGAQLAVSVSLMFDGGEQPIFGAGDVISDPIAAGLPDLPTNYAGSNPGAWFARNDEIARFALADCAHTPVLERRSPLLTGLSAPTE